MVIVDVAREGVAPLDDSSGLKSERPLLSVVPIVGTVRVVVVEADYVGVGPAHPLDVVEELSICSCGAIKPCHLRERVFSRLRERSMVLLSPEATISTDKVPYLPIYRRRSSATRRAPKEPPVLGLEFIAEGVEIDDQ
jgi:hypothetical protein